MRRTSRLNYLRNEKSSVVSILGRFIRQHFANVQQSSQDFTFSTFIILSPACPLPQIPFFLFSDWQRPTWSSKSQLKHYCLQKATPNTFFCSCMILHACWDYSTFHTVLWLLFYFPPTPTRH